ncbi:hypothetical protein L1987_71552 [Smallanthus sonchifolius]|uniref:Uncharacterized protein n=1 Tax=Smallanthus sonchifolius TaxID=185202 RepID=A0ACB9AS52_9ASTR|nr:hypothetical protein L1987_71552 [Smallanthus sonchifolius]
MEACKCHGGTTLILYIYGGFHFYLIMPGRPPKPRHNLAEIPGHLGEGLAENEWFRQRGRGRPPNATSGDDVEEGRLNSDVVKRIGIVPLSGNVTKSRGMPKRIVSHPHTGPVPENKFVLDYTLIV